MFAKDGRGPGEEQHYEIWLARGRDGALLAKTVIIRHKNFNNFGSAGQINLGISGVQWNRLGMPVRENTKPFSEAELSSVRRASSFKYVEEKEAVKEMEKTVIPVQKCPLDSRLVEFNQKILDRLPKGGALTLFEPDPGARHAADCAPIRVTLGLTTIRAGEVSTFTSALLRERMLRDFEVIESKAVPHGTETKLRVTIPSVQ